MQPPPENYWTAHTDGGARGNPGPAGYGVVIHDSQGNRVAALSQYLGRQTNNFAEYQALIAALEHAAANGVQALRVISDSELLVRQIHGIYKVKEPTLRDLHARARQLISQLQWFDIQHVLRGHNREADQLANEAMDKGAGRRPERAVAADGRELHGVVRDGKIELLDGDLPQGTSVVVRVRPR
jgi:ribonuclease HI